MVGQDDEARRPHGREVAEGPRAVRPVGVAVAQRGGVAVVTVRDVGLHAAEERTEAVDRAGIVHSPEAVADAPVVGVPRDRGMGEGLEGEGGETGGGVGEHEEDRAEVGAGRLQDAPTVLLGRRAGVLVRQDDAALGVLRAEAREEAEAPERAAVVLEALLEDVQRRKGGLLEDAVREPPAVGLPRLPVPRVAGRPVEDHAHDVPRVAGVELVPVGGRDHVVGRGQHAGELGVGAAVPDGAEGLDLGHGRDGTTTRPRAYNRASPRQRRLDAADLPPRRPRYPGRWPRRPRAPAGPGPHQAPAARLLDPRLPRLGLEDGPRERGPLRLRRHRAARHPGRHGSPEASRAGRRRPEAEPPRPGGARARGHRPRRLLPHAREGSDGASGPARRRPPLHRPRPRHGRAVRADVRQRAAAGRAARRGPEARGRGLPGDGRATRSRPG